MSKCSFCSILQGKTKAEKIYEDTNTLAVLHPKPAAPGHILILPKKHYQIFEQLPDYEAASLLKTVNKTSIALFEAIHPKGTNIFIQNGVAAGQEIPHLSVHIIPRDENDNIPLTWAPKQLNEEEMSTVELKLKKGAENIGDFEKEEKKEIVNLDEKKPVKKLKFPEKGENYLIKQLERIP